MKPSLLLMLALVMSAALLPRGAAAQPTIDLGHLPITDVAVDADRNLVYVSVLGLGEGADGVAVIDGASNRLVATVPLTGALHCWDCAGTARPAVAVNPATNRIYVTAPGNHRLSVIDGTTNTVVATVPVDLRPVGVAVNPNTNLIYVTGGDNVSVIDGGTNTVVANVALGDWNWPQGVAVNPATNRIYVTNGLSGTVSVIDGGTNTVVATVPVGQWPVGVAVNLATNLIYVANSAKEGSSISVIDGHTNAVVATLPMGTWAGDVAVNPTTNRIYVATGSPQVWVIDGATNSRLPTLNVTYPALEVAANPVTNLVYVGTTLYMGSVLNEVEVISDSAGAPPPPAASPTPPPPPTPTACPPSPAPPPADGMEWVALLCGTCNPNSTTYPDNTPIATVAGAVTPPGVLESLWEFEGGVWMGWSAEFPEASDLTHMDFLDVVFVCVEGAATFTRPVP